MENSVDYVTVNSNSPDREFGTKISPITQILCNAQDILQLCAYKNQQDWPKL